MAGLGMEFYSDCIGPKARGSFSPFRSALIEGDCVPGAEPDPGNTINRMRAVIERLPCESQQPGARRSSPRSSTHGRPSIASSSARTTATKEGRRAGLRVARDVCRGLSRGGFRGPSAPPCRTGSSLCSRIWARA